MSYEKLASVSLAPLPSFFTLWKFFAILIHMEISTVGVIIFHQSKILMVKYGETSVHLVGTYCFPIELVKPGETLETAAVRIVQYQSGLVIEQSSLIPVPKVFQTKVEERDELNTYTTHLFLCTGYSGELTFDGERTPSWIELNYLPELPLLPNVKEAVEEAKKLMS